MRAGLTPDPGLGPPGEGGLGGGEPMGEGRGLGAGMGEDGLGGLGREALGGERWGRNAGTSPQMMVKALR